GSIAKWRRLFSAYEIPIYIIFDNDPSDDTTGSKRIDALQSVGVQDEDAAGVIESTDWLVEDKYCVFGTDFEICLRASFNSYEDLEAEARETGVTTKPFVARYVAEKLTVDNEHDGWQKMTRLKDSIAALVPVL